MGCGSSKDVEVLPSQPAWMEQKPLQVVKDGNVNGNTAFVSPVSHKPPTLQHVQADSTDFPLKRGGFGGSLPPPQPATVSKEQLLHGKFESAHNLHDPRSIAPPSDIGLENFTKNVLLPPDTEEVVREVKFVETTQPPPPSNTSQPKPLTPPSSPPVFEVEADLKTSQHSPYPDISGSTITSKDDNNMSEKSVKDRQKPLAAAGGQDVAEQVRLQMEQMKEQEKAAQEQRESDKLKRQQTLKEKLRQRSEMKKQKLATTAGAVETQRASEEIQDAVQPKLRDLTLDPSATDLTLQPTLPVTKKEVLYSEENIELFRDLEQYAVNMEKVTSEAVTFAILMDSLLIAQLSEIEKARILFHWITAQDLNSINFPSQIEEDTPLGFLLSIKEDRKTYASLFLRLCGAASLHGKLITGFLKGVGYYPDYKFNGSNDPFRGSWNAVLIDGQWRIIDTNWGARHVTEEEEISSGGWQTEYKYEEHYFLTDADQMINTHFPDEPEWQLLPDRLSLQDFEKSTKLWPLFFKLKLEQLSHTEGMVYADENGYVKIQLKVSPFARADAKFKGDLRPRNKQSATSTGNLLQHLFHYSTDDTENFEIMLPSSGQYLLKIFGLSTKYSEKDVYTNICMYQINCPSTKSPPSNASVLPPLPGLSTVYGPTVTGSETIAKPMSHPGPIVECDKIGEAKVTMCLTASDKNILFSHDLIDSSSTPGTLENRIVHTIIAKNGVTEITFVVRTPRKGNFALALYSNIADTSSGTFTPFCYYLVSSKLQQKETQGFPPVPNSRLGQMEPKFSELSLGVVACHPSDKCDWKYGQLRTDANGECNLVLNHSKPLTMLVDFSCPSVNINLNGYSNVETTGKYTIITIRTPAEVPQGTVFALKIYAAEWDQTQGIPSVFLAFVSSETQPNVRVDPMPQSPSRCWGPSGIAFGKYGLKKISFKNSLTNLSNNIAALDNEMKSCTPSRVYNGGEDFEMNLELASPLQLKARLLPMEGNPNTSLDNYVLLDRADPNSTSVKLRVVQPGVYSLVVYGCSLDDSSGQLSPLIYILLRASAPSSCVKIFPTTFGVWTSSARNLISPLCGEIEKNQEVVVKLFLAQFQKSAGSNALSVVPYAEAMLVIDGKTPVTPINKAEGNYEWKYVPGPGEKMAGVLVKPQANSESMTYALQFRIV